MHAASFLCRSSSREDDTCSKASPVAQVAQPIQIAKRTEDEIARQAFDRMGSNVNPMLQLKLLATTPHKLPRQKVTVNKIIGK
jgi:hypothetical protein